MMFHTIRVDIQVIKEPPPPLLSPILEMQKEHFHPPYNNLHPPLLKFFTISYILMRFTAMGAVTWKMFSLLWDFKNLPVG